MVCDQGGFPSKPQPFAWGVWERPAQRQPELMDSAAHVLPAFSRPHIPRPLPPPGQMAGCGWQHPAGLQVVGRPFPSLGRSPLSSPVSSLSSLTSQPPLESPLSCSWEAAPQIAAGAPCLPISLPSLGQLSLCTWENSPQTQHPQLSLAAALTLRT